MIKTTKNYAARGRIENRIVAETYNLEETKIL
jgi:hypothetical protein